MVIFPFLSFTPINPPSLAVLPQQRPALINSDSENAFSIRCIGRFSLCDASRSDCPALSRYTPKCIFTVLFAPLILPNTTSPRRAYTSASASSRSPVPLRTRQTQLPQLSHVFFATTREKNSVTRFFRRLWCSYCRFASASVYSVCYVSVCISDAGCAAVNDRFHRDLHNQRLFSTATRAGTARGRFNGSASFKNDDSCHVTPLRRARWYITTTSALTPNIKICAHTMANHLLGWVQIVMRLPITTYDPLSWSRRHSMSISAATSYAYMPGTAIRKTSSVSTNSHNARYRTSLGSRTVV